MQPTQALDIKLFDTYLVIRRHLFRFVVSICRFTRLELLVITNQPITIVIQLLQFNLNGGRRHVHLRHLIDRWRARQLLVLPES